MKISRLAPLGFALLAVIAVSMWSCSESGDSVPQVSILHRGLPSDPETLDPHKARSTQAHEILRDIGEGLTAYSPSAELVAGAAASWTVSDDGLVYTFTIRNDAKWSNGDPLTAEQFVYSWRRLVNPATAAFNAHFLADVVNATAIANGDMQPAELAVVALDEKTLQATLVQPTAYFLSLLTNPSTFPVHPGSIAELGDAFARPGNLLSSGAYVLDEWQPGSLLRLSRNEYYWNNANTAIDAVNHHVITQEMTELNRYRAGELQITAVIPPDSYEQVRKERPDEVYIAPTLGVYYYGFNLTKPPFKDNPQLRQALSMSIDRELLVQKVIGRGEIPAYSWVPPGVDNYEPRRFSYAGMSQEERNASARRLYRDAGYDEDNPLQIELRYNTSDTQQRTALAIQSMWREALGVETTLINEEFQVLLANMRAADVTQVFRSSWIGDYNDAHTFLSILQSGHPSNMPRYASADFDSLMQRAATQANPENRRVYLEEAERELLTDHPVIPIYFYVSEHLVSPEVQGWQDNVLDYHYSQHLSLATD